MSADTPSSEHFTSSSAAFCSAARFRRPHPWKPPDARSRSFFLLPRSCAGPKAVTQPAAHNDKEKRMSVDVKYKTSATAVGGRDGRTRTEDGKIDLQLAVPKELGGPGGEGSNPEQLFAAGYAACFLGAVKVAGQQLKVRVPPDAAVIATVGIGAHSEGGFGITAELGICLPDVDQTQARQVVDLAHQICPYSNATRNNVDVSLNVL